MRLRTLTQRSLRFHWRSHLGVLLGAAIGSAALIGALIVGDSVKGSLRERALERLGNVHFALQANDRFVRASLGDSLTVSRDGGGPTASGLLAASAGREGLSGLMILPGTCTRADGSARANQVQVLGVSPQNWPAAARWRVLPEYLSGWQGEELDRVAYVHPHHADLLTRSGQPAAGWLAGESHPVAGLKWTPAQRERLRRVAEESAAWQRGETAFVNESFAGQLNLRPGDEFVLRVRKASAIVGEVIVRADDDATAIRLKVGRILSATETGDFALDARATPPANVFLPLNFLGQAGNMTNRVNALVHGRFIEFRSPGKFPQAVAQRIPFFVARAFPNIQRLRKSAPESVDTARSLAHLNVELSKVFRPEDAQLIVQAVGPPLTATGGEYIRPFVEVVSPRIFLDTGIERAALITAPGRYEPFITNGAGVLTLLANLISAGTNAVPYSMVTAGGSPWTPSNLRDDEMVISDWLAADLQAKPGDTVAVQYYLPESGIGLTEATNWFRIHSVVPIRGVHADRTLMPQFPGIEKAETTAEWDTAFPLVHKIRPQDDDYWTQWRGTPKAFVTLAAGQAMWGSRFGNLTAIRFPVPTNSFDSTVRNEVYENLRANLKPAELGLSWRPVREQALKAVEESQPFGQLFIGFSLFVIVAALLLMALLFQFSLEQRTAEIGTLLALGFAPTQVRRLFLREGAALAFIGGILGTLGGIGYARAMLLGLTTLWSDAVGGSALNFFVTPTTLAIGLLASTVVAVVTLWLALRKQARQPARVLLAGGADNFERVGRSERPREPRAPGVSKLALLTLIAAFGLIGWAIGEGDTANAGAFFGAGALVLIAGLAFVSGRLRNGAPSIARQEGAGREPGRAMLGAPITFGSLALRGLTRRRSRSVATVAMLACGTFLIVSIGVFRLDANRDATKRTSGTGGFALIGESTMPVVADLNTKAGREAFALNETDFADVNIVQFRVRAGDEASCLNLNRAQKPRLLGVDTSALEGRFTFAKGAWALLGTSGTQAATRNPPPGAIADEQSPIAKVIEVPAIGDANSIQWAMGKQVGDTLDYVDERGQPFKVRIVGAVANSILQGQLIIDEAEFVKRFPSESGYKYFLIDAPTNRVPDVSAKLSRALQDAGLELTPAPQRLAQFNAVQNTYLGTFQILGGLGLLIGSAGLGVVVLRNVLERRGELAVLLAVGWRRGTVNQLVLREHLALLGLGLAVGLVAAFVAVLPSLLTPGTEFPWLTLGLTLAAVLANGVLWTWLATRAALRGELLTALRGE